jgi:ABC-type lipoprotein release transport system permease subunit
MRTTVWWRIGWRNLWRGRRRTLITAGALALGFFSATIMVGLSEGIVAQMIENGTQLITGQLQVHHAGYKPERSLYSTIGGREGVDVEAMVAAVTAHPEVVGASPRVYGGGLVSSGSETSAGILMGVDLQRERQVSRLLDGLRDGRLPEPGQAEVLLGSEMARKLEVEPGAELVLVAAAADGSLGNDLYTVVGVFHTGMEVLDAGYAVLSMETLQDLLVLDRDRIHEIAASMHAPWSAGDVATDLEADLEGSVPEIAVEGWLSFRPDLAEYAQLAASANWIIVAVVFIMAIFGVANTMLMATFERRREFAVIRALGSARSGIIQTVLYEGIVLGVISLMVGAAITLPVMFWWSVAPPSLSALVGDFTMAGSLVQANLRVVLSWQTPIMSAAALFVTAIVASLYPAIRSARVPPADALAGAE